MKDLAHSNLELEKSNNLKNKLLSIISHDVKGPVKNLQAMVDMVLKGYVTEEEFRQHISKLGSNLDATQTLLDNILKWAMHHINDDSGKKESILLEPLIIRSLELIKTQAESKGNSIKVNLGKNALGIQADEGMLEIIIRNLLTNANKFTEQGSITISTNIKENHLELSISDTGIGMNESEVNRLFKWDQRSSKPGTRAEKGTGLGILICKEFTEAMGGTFHLTSKVGKGTTFTLILPSNQQ